MKTKVKKNSPKAAVTSADSYEKQSTLELLARYERVSLHSLYAKAGLDYDTEMKNKKAEIKDLKEIAFLLQQPYVDESSK